MDTDARPDPLGDAPPEPPDEPANPYAEEDDTHTPLTHSELVAYVLEALAAQHLEYLKQASGEQHPLRQRMAAVDFWTDLRRDIRREVDARPNLAPDAWLDALSLYVAFLVAGLPPEPGLVRGLTRGWIERGEQPG